MEFLIEGLVLGGAAGGAAAAALTRLWPAARLGPFGAVALGVLFGAGAIAGLQILGAGALSYEEGRIVWRPVAATLGLGAASGALVAATIALLRLDARILPPLQAAARRATHAVRHGAPYLVLGLGVATLGALALIRHGALWIVNAPRRMSTQRADSEAAQRPAIRRAGPKQ